MRGDLDDLRAVAQIGEPDPCWPAGQFRQVPIAPAGRIDVKLQRRIFDRHLAERDPAPEQRQRLDRGEDAVGADDRRAAKIRRKSRADAFDGDAKAREQRQSKPLRVLEIEPGFLREQPAELPLHIALRHEVRQEERGENENTKKQAKDSKQSLHRIAPVDVCHRPNHYSAIFAAFASVVASGVRARSFPGFSVDPVDQHRHIPAELN